MDLTPEHREAIRAANRRRAYNCPGCGNLWSREADAAAFGAVSGVRYKVCDGCGRVQPITKRPPRFKL